MRNFLLVCLFFMGLAPSVFSQTDESMTFTSANFTQIIAKGKITPETPDHFRAFLKSQNKLGQPWQATIRLTSGGGNVSAGLELGRLIRAHQISVVAVDFCASSCVFVMMGGLNRAVEGEAKIGVHQFYIPRGIQDPTKQQFTGEDLIAMQRLNGRLQDYAQEMGVDVGIIALASKVEPKSMKYLINDEMFAHKLISNTKQSDIGARTDEPVINQKKNLNLNNQQRQTPNRTQNLNESTDLEELRIPSVCNWNSKPDLIMPKVTFLQNRGGQNARVIGGIMKAQANCHTGEFIILNDAFSDTIFNVQNTKEKQNGSMKFASGHNLSVKKNQVLMEPSRISGAACFASVYLMLCDMTKEGIAYHKERFR